MPHKEWRCFRRSWEEAAAAAVVADQSTHYSSHRVCICATESAKYFEHDVHNSGPDPTLEKGPGFATDIRKEWDQQVSYDWSLNSSS